MTDLALPNWPAAMGIDRAAQYVDLSKGTVETLLRQGRFPAPIRLSEGRRGWRTPQEQMKGTER